MTSHSEFEAQISAEQVSRCVRFLEETEVHDEVTACVEFVIGPRTVDDTLALRNRVNDYQKKIRRLQRCA